MKLDVGVKPIITSGRISEYAIKRQWKEMLSKLPSPHGFEKGGGCEVLTPRSLGGSRLEDIMLSVVEDVIVIRLGDSVLRFLERWVDLELVAEFDAISFATGLKDE